MIAAFGGLGSSQHDRHDRHRPRPAGDPVERLAARRAGLTPHEIYVRDAPGVAFVTSTVVQKTESPFLFGRKAQRQGQATGSGIVIDSERHDPHQLARRRERDQGDRELRKRQDRRSPGGRQGSLQRPRRAAHPDRRPDAAPARRSATRAPSRSANRCYAIGNPFDLERTLTTGVISALQREITAPNGFTIDNVLQTDAPINPGNSGGPLLNAAGQVIGINSQIETGGSGDGSVGIGFAVPINTAKSELAQLEKGGTVRGAYLGLTSLTIDGSLSALNLPVKSGALVQSVAEGHRRRKGRHPRRHRQHEHRKRPGRGRRRHHRLDRRQGGQQLRRTRHDIEAKKPGDTITHRPAARQRQRRLRTQDRHRDARRAPNSVPNPNTPEG